MNEQELELVRFLHDNRRGHGPAEAIAYRALLGDSAESRPPPPIDAHDLSRCLLLTARNAAAADALAAMAHTSPHWQAVHRNWETLHRNLALETGGTMVHPWAHATTEQLKLIAARIASGEPPAEITLPLLQPAGTEPGTKERTA